MPETRRLTRGLALVVGLALIAVSCAGSAVVEVAPGTYVALVPSAEQFSADGTGAIPGGFRALAAGGISQVSLTVGPDTVIPTIDGSPGVPLPIEARTKVGDREGSGPLRGARRILVLGDRIFRLGSLVVDSPVIWPGSFTASPVVTLKPGDPTERGPVVSCRSDEPCLLLSLPPDPVGTYVDANDPDRYPNPLASIRITADRIEFIPDDGGTITAPADPRDWSTACGIAESPLWDVPAELLPRLDDPVLVWAPCPTDPGAAIRLVIMERGAIPILALTEDGSSWCEQGPRCLWFAPV